MTTWFHLARYSFDVGHSATLSHLFRSACVSRRHLVHMAFSLLVGSIYLQAPSHDIGMRLFAKCLWESHRQSTGAVASFMFCCGEVETPACTYRPGTRQGIYS